jgi:CubicO group peptidase (beta-lactamase class C family)
VTLGWTEIEEGLREVVPAAMERYAVPGVAVGILSNGEDRTWGFGVTSIEDGRPVDGDTIFMVGSTTKTFTATLVARLVEQGRLSLEDRVLDHLPDLRFADPAVASEVRVWHLLTHTGGWLGDVFMDTGRGDDALSRKMRAVRRKAPQMWPLGTQWSYNNLGFCIAGRVVEVVTGTSYEKALTDMVLKPLGMERSFFFAEDVMTRPFAVGHMWSWKTSELRVARPWGLFRSSAAAGGLASTARDQLRYARFHLGDGSTPDGERLLERETLDMMKRPRAKAGGLASEVGLTWLLDTRDGARIVKHGGSVNGQMSAFLTVPERGFAITVLTNGSRGTEVHRDVVDWALTHALGLRAPERREVSRTPSELDEYAGSYTSVLGPLVIEAREGRLVVCQRIRPRLAKDPDTAAQIPPPVRLAFHSPDQGWVLDDPSRGNAVEFLRDPSGHITFFRWGGRLCPRRP